jgi:hypothetical protein
MTIDYREPWYEIDDPSMRDKFRVELEREVSHGHVLYGRAAEVVARRDDRDDFLVSLEGDGWAIVHLTWRMAPETDPIWPATQVFDSGDEVQERLAQDAHEWDG